MRFANEYGFCELNPLPGCAQVVVSNHAFIYKPHRGKGHGRQNHKLRLKRARELGYDLVLATVRANNDAEKAILLKEGWEFLTSFTSTETGYVVEMWAYHLRDDPA